MPAVISVVPTCLALLVPLHLGHRRRHGHARISRASFVADGYTLVANVGNRKTDLLRGDHERAFRLPHYRDQLS